MLDSDSLEVPPKIIKQRLQELVRWFPIGERNIAELAPYSGPEGEVALARQIELDAKRHADWVEKMRAPLAEMRAHIQKHLIDTDIPDGEWHALKTKLLSEKTKYWFDESYEVALRNCEQSLFDYGLRHLGDAPRDNLLDTYARSAGARASIPPNLLAELEPKLRHINSVPHRMGGPCDPVQGYAAPEHGDLLFQIGSDNAMGWMWADLGALFVYIDPAELKVHRFKQLEARLEGG